MSIDSINIRPRADGYRHFIIALVKAIKDKKNRNPSVRLALLSVR